MIKRSALILALLTTVGSPASSQAPVPVGDEFQVNTYTTGNQDQSAVALDSAGSFIVVWESDGQDGSSWGIHAQRYDPVGAPSGIEIQVNDFTTDGQRFPAVASDAAGHFVVVWTSFGQDGDYNSVQGRRFDTDGMPLAAEFQVNTYTPGNQDQSAVASAADGSFVATWASYRQDDLGWSVQAQRYDADGMPLAGEFQVNTYTSSHQHYPAVATDPAGNFVIVWQSSGQDGSSNSIQGQRYDADGTLLGTEFQVNTYTTYQQRFPDVAVAEDGSFVVVWRGQYQDGSYDSIHGQRFDSTGALVGSEFQANTYTTGFQIDPAVAVLAEGSFLVAWTGPLPAGGFGAQARWYDPDGMAPDIEFRVGTVDGGNPSSVAVASAQNRNLVATWSSNVQDGSGNGIQGRRFVTPIFSDGFESGDAAAWSSFTP